ncbi:MAG: precorrin-6y C5,15-methyltransferase (decarboxylating) subunit CbiE [Desulfobacterales bacterium]
MKPVTILGMGMSPDDLTQRHLRLIHDATVLIGGKRHLAHFQDTKSVKKEITADLEAIKAFIGAQPEDATVVVLASGDPLFHGIGAYLIRHLPEDRVRFLPNVSAVAAAFARIGMPWQAARVVSFHGRQAAARLMAAFYGTQPIAVYTDPHHHPGWIAALLVERGVTGWRMCVLEALGSPQERIRWFELPEAARESFADPNLVIFKRVAPPAADRLNMGMPESAFVHEDGLITKREVRAVVLSKLRLHPGLTLWDLGAGSGAVGVEAALFLKEGRIVAVERKRRRIDQIRDNARRFQVYNLEAVQAELPEGIDRLPDPDRVFIGGGGSNLARIIAAAAKRLPHDGVMVVNTVLTANLEAALQAMQQAGLDAEVVMVQIHRSVPMLWSLRFEAQNPVWIITGEMKDK